MNSKLKLALAEKEAQAKSLKADILGRIKDLPPAAFERVRKTVQDKLDVFRQSLNGNGRIAQ